MRWYIEGGSRHFLSVAKSGTGRIQIFRDLRILLSNHDLRVCFDLVYPIHV